jgi:hypothetical protein
MAAEILQREKRRANNALHATWLIGALSKSFTRIGVCWLAKVLTPHPPSA